MPASVTKRGTNRAVAAAARPLPKPAEEGIVVGIVAVTGTEDDVQDIIAPGAFADTLKKRRPKLCWMHDWKQPLGRVLHIVEVKPGDPRLPKVLPDGRAWPAAAGAVIATMQFNLRTQQGREFFEHAKEWAKNGEAAFSIGYKVREGMASRRADGVRLIYALDLFEVSLVLHGAHNMALALEVKDAAGAAGLETKSSGGLMELKSQPDFSDHAMVALYPSPEVAAKVAHPDGMPAEEMHVTLAYLGKASEIADPNALATHLAGICAQTGNLEGHIGGLGVFPPGNEGTPVFATVDVPGLETLRHHITTGLDQFGQSYSRDHGFTPHMTRGYDLPSVEPLEPIPAMFDRAVLVVGDQKYPLPLTANKLEAKSAVAEVRMLLAGLEGKTAVSALLEAKAAVGAEGKAGVPGVADTPSDFAAVRRLRRTWAHGKMAAKVGWGTPGDFSRCVALASAYMSPEEAKGWCNLRHKDALGIYPATHAKLDGKSALDALFDASKVLPIPQTETTHHNTEMKAMAYMKGSHEEIRCKLDDALTELLIPKQKGDEPGQVSGWVNLDATYADEVFVTVRRDGKDESYRVAYKIVDDEVELGKPVEVELSVVAIPEDESGEPAELEEGAAVQVRFIDPAAAMLSSAAQRLSAVPEGKSLDGIETSLLTLLDSLAEKGYDVAKAVMAGVGEPMWDDDPDMPHKFDRFDTERKEGDPEEEPEGDLPDEDAEPEPEAAPEGAEPEAAPADAAPAPMPPADDEDEGETPNPDKPTVTLDQDAVRAQMDELRA